MAEESPPCRRSAACQPIYDAQRALRRHAGALRQRRRRQDRAQACRLVFQGLAGLGRIPRRDQPDRRSKCRARLDPRLLRAACRAGGGVTVTWSSGRGGGLDTALVLSALPDPVIALDRSGAVRFVNPAAEQFLGISAAALQGVPLSDFVVASSPLFGLVEAVWRNGGSIAEYDVLLAGPRLPARPVTIQGALAGEGADLLVLALHERAIADQMDRQLTHRNAARSMTAMAAMLAHEVKNPLSGIRGAAQLLEQDADDSARQLTQLICDETDRIVALVDRMEAFSDHLPFARGGVNIHEVLERVRRIAQSGFARHVHFAEDYDPSLPLVHGNRDLLVQVFLNLIKNAAEASPAKGGEIVLATG